MNEGNEGAAHGCKTKEIAGDSETAIEKIY